jgi:hypothetical protein
MALRHSVMDCGDGQSLPATSIPVYCRLVLRYATLGLHHAMIRSRSGSNRASVEVSVAQDRFEWAYVASYEDLGV